MGLNGLWPLLANAAPPSTANMMIGGFVITPEIVDGEQGSRVVYLGQIDFRGNVPRMINENLAKKRVACLRFIKHALNRRLFEVA
jgi:hypothetical protein